MSDMFTDLITSLQAEADESKDQIIAMLEARSRDYRALNEKMHKYIERRDAADVLRKEQESR